MCDWQRESERALSIKYFNCTSLHSLLFSAFCEWQFLQAENAVCLSTSHRLCLSASSEQLPSAPFFYFCPCHVRHTFTYSYLNQQHRNPLFYIFCFTSCAPDRGNWAGNTIVKFTADGKELHNSCRSCVEVFSICAGSLHRARVNTLLLPHPQCI